MSTGTYGGKYYGGLTIYRNTATITSTSVIDTPAADGFAVAVVGAGASVLTLNNAGHIADTGADGIGVYFYGTGIMTNTGSIHGATGVALDFGGTIVNKGTISAYATGVTLNGGEFTNAVTGAISIDGDAGVGVKLSGSVIATNAGLIGGLVSQTAPSGYPFITGVVLYGQESFNNTGNIELYHEDGYTGTFTGITTVSGGTITNSGTIAAGFPYYGFKQPKNIPLGGGPHGVRPDRFSSVQDQYIGFGIDLSSSTCFNTGLVAAKSVGIQLSGSSYLKNSGAIGAGQGGVDMDGGTVVNTGGIEASGPKYSAGVYLNGGTLINSGTIEALSGEYQSYGVYANGGAVINQPGGLIIGLIGVEIYGTKDPTLVNAGTISTYGTGTFAVAFSDGEDLLVLKPGADFIGEVVGGFGGGNTIELATGAGIGTLTGLGGTIIDFQSLNVDTGANWSLNGSNTLALGIFVTDNGLLSLAGSTALYTDVFGTGTLGLAGSETITKGIDLEVANLALSAGTATLGYNVTFDKSFTGTGGTVALNGYFLYLDGSSSFKGTTFSGSGSEGGGVLSTSGAVTLSSMRLNNQAFWEIFGTVTETGNLILGNEGGGSGRLGLPETGGLFDITGNGGIGVAVGGAGGVEVYSGVFEKTGGSGTSVIAASVYSYRYGTIADTTGTLEFTGGGSFRGTIDGTGTIQFGRGLAKLYGGIDLAVANLALSGGTLALASPGYNVVFNGGFAMSGGTLALEGNQLFLGAAAFKGGVVSGSGVLFTSGNASLTTLSLTNGAVWQDEGLVTAPGGIYLGDSGGGSGQLTVHTDGGVFDFTGNGGIAVVAGGSGTIASGGLFEKTGGTGTSLIGADMIDTGTITVKTGTIAFTGAVNSFAGQIGGLGSVRFGAGVSTLGSGAVLAMGHLWITGGEVLLGTNLGDTHAFTESGGTLALGGKALTLTGTAGFTGGTVSGGGLITKGTTTLAALVLTGGATWNNGGTLIETGGLTLGGAGGASGRFADIAGSVFDITGNGGIALAAGGAGSSINQGVLEKTSGTGTSRIVGGFNNAGGTIKAISGTLELAGVVSGTGVAAIGSAGTLRFDSTVAAGQSVTFAGKTGGELILHDPSGAGLGFAGTVAGFGGTDRLDLATFSFAGGPKFAWAQSGSKGTLTVTDGTDVAKIILFGQYAVAGFKAAKDSGGGTVVTYTAPAQAVIAAPHH